MSQRQRTPLKLLSRSTDSKNAANRSPEQVLIAQQEALARISQDALQTYNVSDFLKLALGLTANALGLEIARILEWTPPPEAKFILKASRGCDEEDRIGQNLELFLEPQAAYAMTVQHQVVVEDTLTEDRFDASIVADTKGIRSSVSLAMFNIGHTVIGVLEVASREPYAFSNADLTFLHGVANIMVGYLERVHSTETAQEISARYEKMVDIYNYGVTTWNLETDTFEWNARQYEIVGLSPEHFTPSWRYILSLIHPDDRAEMKQLFETHRETGGAFEAQYRMRHAQGEYLYIYSQMTVSANAAGTPILMTWMSLDVTERKQSELKLLEFEERFQALGDSAPFLIALNGVDGVATYLNKAWMDFLGKPHNAPMPSIDWFDIIHPDDVLAVSDTFFKAQQLNQSYSLEFRAKRYDGEYRWMYNMGNPRYTKDGQLVGYIYCLIDITDRKLAEQKTYESEQRFRAMAEASSLIIWIVDPAGQRNYSNQAWSAFTGQRPEKGLGLGWLQSVHADDYEQTRLAFEEGFASGEVFQVEYRIRRYDGEYRSFIDTGGPIFSPEHQLLGYVGSSADITDVRRALELAQEASQRKSEFLAMMSHELRTPLNSIIGYSRMIENGLAGAITDKQQQYIHNVNASGHHLLDIVNEVLDVAQIESGKLPVSKEMIQVEPIVRNVVETLQEMAKSRHVQMELQIAPDLVPILADPVRIKEIFLNLISNGIKFNRPNGVVMVDVSESLDHDWLVAAIRDTGVGIPADKIPELFQAFYQVNASYARPQEGVGLGLLLTKQLVGLHGGNIKVESEEGVGSTFTVRLPLRSADTPETR